MKLKKNIGQAIILCGGYGKRLSEITNNTIHKSVVKIGSYPFIYYILSQLYLIGITKIVLCTGVLSSTVEKEILKFEKNYPNKFKFIFSKEDLPIGTAGALINSFPKLENEYSLVVNGDTFVNDDLKKILHINFKSDIIMLASFKFVSQKYGSLITNKNSELISFNEKKLSFFNFVNAGVSLFKNNILNKENVKYPSNIEDIFYNDPTISIKIVKTYKKFIDIGTKKSFKKYISFFNFLKLSFDQ